MVTDTITIYGELYFLWNWISSNQYFLNDSSAVGICLTQDVDLYLTHMNNTRIAREMDLAAYYFICRTVLADAVNKKVVWKNASTLRFRRPVPLFSIYKINTKVEMNKLFNNPAHIFF